MPFLRSSLLLSLSSISLYLYDTCSQQSSCSHQSPTLLHDPPSSSPRSPSPPKAPLRAPPPPLARRAPAAPSTPADPNAAVVPSNNQGLTLRATPSPPTGGPRLLYRGTQAALRAAPGKSPSKRMTSNSCPSSFIRKHQSAKLANLSSPVFVSANFLFTAAFTLHGC